MDIKEIKRLPVLQRLQETAWPCGDLRTASIAIGLTSLVSTSLLTLHHTESYLSAHGFALELVLVGVAAMFLLMTDVALVFGAVTATSGLLVPWLVLHGCLEVFLVFYLAFKHSELAGVRVLIAVSFLLIAYFILTVFLHYKQLVAPKDPVEDQVDATDGGATAAGRHVDGDGGVHIDMENLNSSVTSPVCNVTSVACSNDDTFSALASRDVSKNNDVTNGNDVTGALDDSGEFAEPASSAAAAAGNSPLNFPLNDSFINPKPPLPDEVIEVGGGGGNATAAALGGSFRLSSTNPFLVTTVAADQNHTNAAAVNDDDEALESLLPIETDATSAFGATTTETAGNSKRTSDGFQRRPPSNSSRGNLMDLVVDNSFTPFKPKSRVVGADVDGGGGGSENGLPNEMPKMKVFLPKANDEDTDDEDGSSSDGGEENVVVVEKDKPSSNPPPPSSNARIDSLAKETF